MLIVSTFPNAKALPLWAAVEIGLFSRFDLTVSLDETLSSTAQRKKLVSGKVHIAQSAIDNALALIASGTNVVIVMGGEGGMNDFIVQADIQDFAGMRGRLLAVDAPDTAYALQARKLLARVGLTEGADYTMSPVGNASFRLDAMLNDQSYGGAILNPPFSSIARLAGMRSLGRMTDLLGSYQAGGAFVMRDWASSNRSILVSYIKSYISALRWLQAPVNKSFSLEILRRRLDLSIPVAEAAFDQLVDPSYGFNLDAKMDMAGLRNVIATRVETEAKMVTLNPRNFVDLDYYDRAMLELDGRHVARSS